MRWVYFILVVLFAAAVTVFAAQNGEMTTISFLRMRLQMPLAFLIIIIYALGALTGGSLFALLRKSIQGARSHRVAT